MYFSNYNVHSNELEILLQCRFQSSSCGVRPVFSISNRLDTHANTSGPRVTFSVSKRQNLIGRIHSWLWTEAVTAITGSHIIAKRLNNSLWTFNILLIVPSVFHKLMHKTNKKLIWEQYYCFSFIRIFVWYPANGTTWDFM